MTLTRTRERRETSPPRISRSWRRFRPCWTNTEARALAGQYRERSPGPFNHADPEELVILKLCCSTPGW
jgi:hypothetical protein